MKIGVADLLAQGVCDDQAEVFRGVLGGPFIERYVRERGERQALVYQEWVEGCKGIVP